MIIVLKNKHTLKVDEFYFKCSIGKHGLSNRKKKVIIKHLKDILRLKIYILEKID